MREKVIHTETQIEVSQIPLPVTVLSYIHRKIERKAEGGRPHFLQILAKDHNVIEATLDILEFAWIKNKSLGSIAKNYNTGSQTIYRLLKDLEPSKTELSEYLLKASRRKRFYISELDSSDYTTIQDYIRRAKRDGLKHYKEQIQQARRAWRSLNYRDPAYWTTDEVCTFLAGLSQGSQSRMLDAVRQIAPQLANKSTGIKTGRFREKLARRKKDLFRTEIRMIHEALKGEQFQEIKTLFDLHITLGAREGSSDSSSGLTGLTWDKFKKDFTRADLFESKVRGGITWRDCPLDLFFKDLPDRLREMWKKRGRSTNEKVFLNGYKGILALYRELRGILRTYYEGQVDPSLLSEFITLRPHDADKIHVNLLWEAEIPLEVVAGQYLGKGEGIGLMGRGWLDINVIKKHYLSLTARSERMKKLVRQVRTYSQFFND